MNAQQPIKPPIPDPFRLSMEPGYHALGEGFFTQLSPERVTDEPVLVHASPGAAALIGLPRAAFAHPDAAAVLSGLKPLPGYQPLAMVYSGHQFGQWAGQLGDGRALTIGQVKHDQEHWDIQLKGAGRTPYSRFGDGRAVVRSSIREYLCSEAMAALGVPTTRALALVGTRRPVRRETVEPGAVVTRLMRSNIRFGHFEHFHHNGDLARVRLLADFVIAQHFPDLAEADDRHALWFDEVAARTARLMAHWQAIGFAHGVMNTDNMSILGDTLDYGPFGFLDTFDPGFICNHTDQWGRYAFDRQPGIGLWNLQALATALQSLIAWERMQETLQGFVPRFVTHYTALMRAKIGLISEQAGDEDLITDLLSLMKASGADYPLAFRLLAQTADNPGRARWTALFNDETRAAAFAWLERWQARIAHGGAAADVRARMDAVNPKFVLRNWVAETAIRAVEDEGDVATLDRIFQLVTQPFAEHGEADAAFAGPPPEAMLHLEVSCSS
jgi:serine/tyrosine/threonine adenylyltransferase